MPFYLLVTRAVHLDIVPDASTGTFIRCLKRFAARRGLPRKFVSDNAKTFKAAAKFFEAVFKDNVVQEHLVGQASEWLFNLERAPWWGGAFERMVRCTKRCLRKMVGRANFSYDELLTAITEIESVFNSRPLSYVSASDQDEPVTPSHLMIGRRVLNLPDHLGYLGDPTDEDFSVDSTQLTRRVKHLGNALNHFWRRWRSEYLQELREGHRQLMRKASKCSRVSVGDVVIVHDVSMPRGLWKLGRVQQLIVGQDGHVRGATVRVVSRDRQHVLLRRPLRLLYLLEVGDDVAPSNDQDESTQVSTSAEDEVNPQESLSPPGRPQRTAAKRAEECRRIWIHELKDD